MNPWTTRGDSLIQSKEKLKKQQEQLEHNLKEMSDENDLTYKRSREAVDNYQRTNIFRQEVRESILNTQDLNDEEIDQTKDAPEIAMRTRCKASARVARPARPKEDKRRK